MWPRLPDGVKLLSVSQLTHNIKGVLEEGFARVWVSGQISNYRRQSSGHCYLTLKDEQAQLKLVIWRQTAFRLRIEPRDGQEVIVSGRLSLYPQRGEYQLVVDQYLPKGIGALEQKFRELRDRLERLGFFARERKKALPVLPARVALVTSPSGAAVRDILEVLARRWPAAEIWLCPVRVQGEGAAEEIAGAIQLLNRLNAVRHRVDVMIVGRGGGSLEDLWAFNEECVARAIHDSAIPVVSAVGHEVDVTIADLVADRRALTPSEAAELVVPSRPEQAERLERLESRLRSMIRYRLDLARRNLDGLAERRVLKQPFERLRERERRLDDLAERLQRATTQLVESQGQRMAALAAQLESLSPLNVLARGYTLTCKESAQEMLRRADQVQPGERIVTRLAHGRLVSRVEETHPEG
ncbi:MAG: exodeoxyribonuclease VII large subunit [Gemmataceae bacterium]